MQQREIKNRKKRYQRKKHLRIARICGLFFVCFLLVFGVGYLSLYRKVSKVPKDKACDGVYIGEVNVSGLTRQQAQKALEEQEEKYKNLNFAFEAGKENVPVTLGELGFAFEKEERLVKEAVEYGNNGGVWDRYFKLRKLKKEKKVFPLTYSIDKENAGEVLKEKVGGFLENASDAKISRTNGNFVITDEKEGVELDEKATLKAVETFLNEKWNGKESNIKVVTKAQKPAVVRADLEGIKDNLGTFSTYCGSGQARVTNIIRGVELINGSVVMPGEEFSAGKTMMPFTRKNKYVEAGAYENGEVVASVAGGICQVSTTLYNAAINAELDIVKRYPHSMVVNYVKPSRDAAIAGDYKDLVIRNNYDTPIFIEGYVSDGNVVFNIFGTEIRPKGRELKFISETIETEEPKKKFEEESESKIGVIREPASYNKGRKAQLWKAVYENGKEVSRKVFNKSTYNPSAYKVMVGTASSNPEYTALVRKAIRSQDEEKIKAAIAEVKKKEKEAKRKEEAESQSAEPQPEAEQPPQQEEEER